MEFIKIEDKYYLNGGHRREISRKSFIDICRVVVREISPVKPDNINSVSKLLKIIEYETVPDSSDDESDKKPPKKAVKPESEKVQKIIVRKPPPKAPIDSDDSDETDDE